jgi:hypothetical protein
MHSIHWGNLDHHKKNIPCILLMPCGRLGHNSNRGRHWDVIARQSGVYAKPIWTNEKLELIMIQNIVVVRGYALIISPIQAEHNSSLWTNS